MSSDLAEVVCIVILLGLNLQNGCSSVGVISNCKNCKFTVIRVASDFSDGWLITITDKQVQYFTVENYLWY